jgi:hypothetical protein
VKKRCLDDVFARRLDGRGVERAADEACREPVLALTLSWAVELLDVRDGLWLDDKAALLQNLTTSGVSEIFRSFGATTWRDPEIVGPWLVMTNKEDLAFVFEQYPGRDAVFHWRGGLTFDVRGGPLAGRPLDGGVRCHRPELEANNTHRRLRHDGQRSPFVPVRAEA